MTVLILSFSAKQEEVELTKGIKMASMAEPEDSVDATSLD
jgi:hypothetical protein